MTDTWTKGQIIPLSGFLPSDLDGSGRNVTVSPMIEEISKGQSTQLTLTLEKCPGPLAKCFRRKRMKTPRNLSVVVDTPPTLVDFLRAIGL